MSNPARLNSRRTGSPAARTLLAVMLASVGLTANSAFAANATWSGAGDTLWSNTANWSASPVPGTGNTATFNTTSGNTTIDLTGGVTIGTILFDTASAAAYTIGAGAVGSQTLTFDATGAVTMNSTVANNQLFNANLLLGTAVASTTTITNNSTTNSLTFAGTIAGGTGGTAAAKTLAIAGAGNTTISGAISNGGGSSLALTKSGAGTLTLSGTNTNTGTTTVNGGTLLLDFNAASAPASNILVSGNALTLGGGTFSITGKASTTSAQTMGALTLTANTGSAINVTSGSGGTANLTLGAITRNTATALDITLPSSGTVTSTTTTATNGVATAAASGAAYATANGGATWLTNSSGTLGALASYATGNANYTSLNNVDVTTGDSVSGATVNTLRFNSASDALTLTGTNIVTTGGILVTSAGTGSSITGGTLTSGITAAELVLHDYSTLNVGSVIANNGVTAIKLTHAGTGTTTLSGANTYTGGTSVSSGTLKAGVASVANVSGAFGKNSAVTVGNKNGATLDLNGFNTQVGSLAGGGTLGGTVALGSSTLTIGGDNTSTSYSGVLSGTGNLVKIGTGTQTLSNFNASSSYITGSTTINGGGLTINVNNTGGNTSSTGSTTINGGTLTLVHSLTNGVTFTGVTNAIGNGALTMAGGSLASNTASSSGNLIQNFSSFTLGSGFSNITNSRGSSSQNQVLLAGAPTRNAGGTLNVYATGSGTSATTFVSIGGTSGTTLGYATMGSNDFVKTNGAAGVAAATYTADTWASGNNTNIVTASTSVAANSTTGTVRFNTVGAATVDLGATGTSVVSLGGILVGSTVGANTTTITGSGANLTSGNGTDLILINNNTTAGSKLVINANITDNAGTPIGLTVGPTTATAVTGTVELGGTNTFTGASYINGGKVVLTSAGAWNGQSAVNFAPAGSLTGTNVGSFTLNGFNATVGGLTTTQTGLTNPVVQNANATGATLTVNLASGSNTYTGTIVNGTGGGTLGLTKSGAGTLTLSNTNTYTGATIINGGTLALGASNVLATGSAITLGGGTLNLGGFSQAAFTNALTMTSGSTIDFGTHVTGLTLKFGDSSLATWTGSLALLNFTVGTDNLSFTSVSGLTVGQLSQITLSGYTATGLDSSGNVQFSVSSVPEPATYAALAGLGILGFSVYRRRRA